MSNDWEVFNENVEFPIKGSAFLNWTAKHTIEFNEVDKELTVYGSYIVSYHKVQENAVAYEKEMMKMLDAEDYPYLTWYIKNQAKNTPYKYIVLVQIGAFLEEHI